MVLSTFKQNRQFLKLLQTLCAHLSRYSHDNLASNTIGTHQCTSQEFAKKNMRNMQRMIWTHYMMPSSHIRQIHLDRTLILSVDYEIKSYITYRWRTNVIVTSIILYNFCQIFVPPLENTRVPQIVASIFEAVQCESRM